MITGDASQGSE